MRIIISEKTQWQVAQTARYLKWRNGTASRNHFMEKFKKAKDLLRQHPKLGPVEPLLEELPKTYRSFVLTPLNKLIYTIVDDVIEVVDLWDTRCDPSQLADEVRSNDDWSK